MSKPLEAHELKALKGQEVWLIPLYNSVKKRTNRKYQQTTPNTDL